VRTIRRGGPYLRVANPGWNDPLDGGHAALRGGRWNPPESFPVVYLCRGAAVARANVYRQLARQPYGPEDLRPGAGPVLVATRVPEDRYLNVVTDAGCAAVGLPRGYPRDGRGRIVPHRRCRPIGERAHERGLPGIAARSAAPSAPDGGEELAYFGPRRLRRGSVRTFDQWFWEEPSG
jgi:RES domain-containing protein